MVGCWGVRSRALEKKVAEAGRVRLGEVNSGVLHMWLVSQNTTLGITGRL